MNNALKESFPFLIKNPMIMWEVRETGRGSIFSTTVYDYSLTLNIMLFSLGNRFIFNLKLNSVCEIAKNIYPI